MQDALNRSSGEEISDPLSNDIIGGQVAVSLAKSACGHLSQNELTQFINFFLYPEVEASDEIVQRFHELKQEFYSLEIQESSERLDRLAQPSGPLDASLGLIMHCQSKEGPGGPFWDMKSPTIQALATKGVSDAFAFGFDWHWRGRRFSDRSRFMPHDIMEEVCQSVCTTNFLQTYLHFYPYHSTLFLENVLESITSALPFKDNADS